MFPLQTLECQMRTKFEQEAGALHIFYRVFSRFSRNLFFHMSISSNTSQLQCPQFKSHLLSLSRLFTQTLHPNPNPPKLVVPILLSLLLRTNLIPLPNLPPLLPSPALNPSPFNAVIAAFSRSGFPSLALRTLSLLHRLAFPLDSYSLCSSLTAAASAAVPPNLDRHGNAIHAVALKSGHLSNIFVCGALVECYAKSGDVDGARKVFDEIPIKNVVCVNSLLNGYVERKRWMDGIYLFRRMWRLGLEPNELTLCGVVRTCAEAALLGLGMQAHGYLVRRVKGGGDDLFLLSSLVEMYGKCGLVDKARLVFEFAGREKGVGRDVVMWTSMLNAYSRNGMFEDVIRAFEEMLVEKTKPDEVVFLVALSACGRSGNVTKGIDFLELMRKDCALVPGPEHYGCVVDMLCKAGELDTAWKFVNKIVVEEGNGGGSRFGVSVWGAILSACRNCGNAEMGKIAASKALDLEPHNVGIYMELSNLYAGLGMWDEILVLREVMKESGLVKYVGFSWLERTN